MFALIVSNRHERISTSASPLPYCYGERLVPGGTAGLISPATGRLLRRSSSILTRSAYLRRLAALRSTSLAHVTGFASSDSAADMICCFSDSDSGIFISSVRRSPGLLGGLPRFVSMSLNIPIKIVTSSLAIPINYGYDKYSKRKPSEALARDRGPPQLAFA